MMSAVAAWLLGLATTEPRFSPSSSSTTARSRRLCTPQVVGNGALCSEGFSIIVIGENARAAALLFRFVPDPSVVPHRANGGLGRPTLQPGRPAPRDG